MPPRTRRTIQWHPDVHRVWAGEQLYFWRLAFSPTYDRDDIVGALQKALKLHGVTAYTVYELFAGGYDAFLRVWLPTSQGAFEQDLQQALGQYSLVAQAFWVDRILVHWPWESEPGALDIRPVDEKILRRRLPDAEIARINRSEISRAKREEYQALGLIAAPPRKRGVKFFTVVSTHQSALPRFAHERLEARIRTVLQEAKGIDEKSMYAGVGFGQYLLMGRVSDYFAIERELTTPLNDAVDPSMFGARTTTFPVSRPDFLDSAYDLRLGEEDPGPSRTAAEALEEEESQTLEVKGSAFVRLTRWLRGDGKLDYDEAVVDDGVLRATTGLLNADGGTLVVGALERARFEDEPKLADLPRRGPYIVVGIEPDVDGDSWDRYERRLRVLLEKRVRPDPNPWISITRELVDDTPVCVVTVRAPEQWSYHYPRGNERGRFWVRQGNRTVELEGPTSDAYRREKAR